MRLDELYSYICNYARDHRVPGVVQIKWLTSVFAKVTFGDTALLFKLIKVKLHGLVTR